MNPSTRPIVAKSTGKQSAGPPSPPETRQGSPAGAADDPLNDGAAPGGDANADNSPTTTTTRSRSRRAATMRR